MNYILIIIGFILLIKGSDLFIDGAKNISKVLKISPFIIGLTIVAFGTSAPETFVSVVSSINNKSEISFSNALGSNYCNLLLVLGISGLFNDINLSKKFINKDYLFSVFTYFVLLILLFYNFYLGKDYSYLKVTEGLILISFLVLYFVSLKTKEKDNNVYKKKFKISYLIYLMVGLISLLVGAKLVIFSASSIARSIGITDRLISITMIAVGTSLPELITSLISIKKKEEDILLGNIIGSNIYNILFILGLSSLFNTITITFNSFIDTIVLLIISIILYIVFILKRKITKKTSIFLLITYFIYMIYIFNFT